MNEIVWREHPSWRGMVSWYVKALLIVAVGVAILYLAYQSAGLAWGWVALGAVCGLGGTLGVGYMKRYTTTYTITKRDVYEKTGILNTVQERASIDKITNITIERSLSERILGIGRVNIDTANDSEDILDWWGVPNPYHVEQIIDELRIERSERND